MDEHTFRDRLRTALGEPPGLPSAATLLDRAMAEPLPRARPFLVGALAGVLLVGSFAGVVTAIRLNSHPASQKPALVTHPSPSPSPRLQGPILPCSLPAIVDLTGGPPPYSQATYGFVAVPGGTFSVDAQAVNEMAAEPKDGIEFGSAVGTYSSALRQWLPVQGQQVSPDGTQYAYSAYLPAGANASTFQSTQLRVYDPTSRSSRLVWSSPDQVSVLMWSAGGILVETIPKGGGSPEDLTVDPASGTGTQGLPANTYIADSVAGALAGPSSTFGRDPQGDVLAVKHASTSPGTPYSVTIYEPSGAQIAIYSGAIGDPTGFNPNSAFRQGTSFWFTDSSNNRLWLWSQGGGLRRFPLSGLPTMPAGIAHPSEFAAPVGMCR